MLRRLGIRGKVLAALSVPVLVLFLLAGIVSWQAIQDVRTTRAWQDVLTSLDDSRLVITAMQAEREASVPLVGPLKDQASTDLDSVRAATDAAINRFRASSAEVDLSVLDPAIADTFGTLYSQLGMVDSSRAYVDGGRVTVLMADGSFSDAIAAVVGFGSDVANDLDDRQLAGVVGIEAGLTQLIESYRHEQVLGREVVAAGVPSGETLKLVELFPEADKNRLVLADEVYDLRTETRLTESMLPGMLDSYYNYRKQLTEFVNSGVAFPANIKVDNWFEKAGAEVDLILPVMQQTSDKATSRAKAVADSSLRDAVLTISLTVSGVLLSIIIALAIARQIVRPLRRLTDAAGTVRDELPHLVEQVAIPGQGPDLRLTRIPVTSRDEIGRLAAAFNEVNETTIEVAQEQAALRASIAEMFVNVARRDQVLLNRQLSFIDALERSEENPKILADLFRLDHLATRMRRNAESLLVLAGIDSGRRLREALPTSDVIRTASSEIEHYERIQLDLPVDPMMLGHTALSAAHMLAELLENATVFSDPGTPVHVSTGIDERHVIVTILDQGLGMAPEDLAEANSRMHTSSAGDVLGSQRLGLYVVGRIATRLGCEVELTRGPGDKGTLGMVRMPLVLFVDPESIPITAPTEHGKVETFILPEEAAAAQHDTAFAPVPIGVQDVAPGQYGSAENPAEEVDIAALVEGQTDTGLPKRRSHGEAAPSWTASASETASASAIPLAPAPEALAGAAGSHTGEAWQPPVIQTSSPLSARRRTEALEQEAAASQTAMPTRRPAAPGSGLPTRTATGSQPPVAGSGLPTRTATGSQPPVPQSTIGGQTTSGLPARRPSSPGQPTAPEAVSTASATGPTNVEGRTAMFAGFRSRRAELQAAAVQEAGAAAPTGTTDAVERLAVAATGAAAFFRRGEADETPGGAEGEEAAGVVIGEPAEEQAAPEMVIPTLVEDEEEFGDVEFTREAPASPQQEAQPAATGWAPVKAWEEAGQAPAAPAWQSAAEPAPQAPEEPAAPAWQAPAAAAPQAPAAPAWQGPLAAVSQAPAWQGTEAPAAEVEPAAAAPAPSFQVESEAAFGAASAPSYGPLPPPYEPFPYRSTLDFSELVKGPTRRSLREPQGRRGLFRRSRKGSSARPVPSAPAAASAPAFAPPFEDVEPVIPVEESASAGFGIRTSPTRQSAWGAPVNGSHVVADAETIEQAAIEAPVWQPPTFGPAPVAPAPVEAAPLEPEPFAPAFREAPTETLAPQPAWQAPAAPFEPEPAPTGGATWQPSEMVEETQQAWPQHEAPVHAPAAAAPAPAAPRSAAPAPAQYSGATSFTPQPMFGFDDEMTSMLAQRADIAQQALAELNQLSMYRPQAVATTSSSSLVRRTPGTIPAAPAIALSGSAPRPARDANQVRSLLSSFQSGTSRGRQVADGGDDTHQDSGGDGRAGSEEDPAGHGEPVTTPDTDLNPRDTTW
jgi:signal transduction histidine kinase